MGTMMIRVLNPADSWSPIEFILRSNRFASVGKGSEPKRLTGKKTTVCHNLTSWFKFWRVFLATNLLSNILFVFIILIS